MLAAIVVGGLTAWYLGLNAGIIAAIATAAALILGNVVPGLTLTVYVAVIGWCAALYFLGPKMSKGKGLKDEKAGTTNILGNLVGAAGQATSWIKKRLANEKKS
ncbi:MAG: hypothetical protein ACKV2T_38495 [Kofleriaceae bacterium]